MTATTLQVHPSFPKTFPKAFVTVDFLCGAAGNIGVSYIIFCSFYLSEMIQKKKKLAQEKDIMKIEKVGPKKGTKISKKHCAGKRHSNS